MLTFEIKSKFEKYFKYTKNFVYWKYSKFIFNFFKYIIYLCYIKINIDLICCSHFEDQFDECLSYVLCICCQWLHHWCPHCQWLDMCVVGLWIWELESSLQFWFVLLVLVGTRSFFCGHDISGFLFWVMIWKWGRLNGLSTTIYGIELQHIEVAGNSGALDFIWWVVGFCVVILFNSDLDLCLCCKDEEERAWVLAVQRHWSNMSYYVQTFLTTGSGI